MLRRDAKVELIRRAPLFARCTKKDLQRIASLADEMDFPAGKRLTEEGATGREFFVLIDGGAEVVRGGSTVDHLRAGDFFGEIALVTDRPRIATVTTTAPTKTLVLTGQGFRNLLEELPGFHLKMLGALADRLADDFL